MRAGTLSWPPALSWSRYLEVLKPRETALLTFIGAMAGVVAGTPSWGRLLLVTLAVALGSAGVNGLTNYLDREVDARMERTRDRALPSRAIYPPEKVLPLCGGLVALALALAWYLHPWAMAAGLMGIASALVGRKSTFTHLLGGISGSAPVLVGWLAVSPQVTPLLGLLVLLIMAWVPLHVWSLMLAYKEDYLRAGVRVFPLNRGERQPRMVLTALAVLIYVLSQAIYLVGGLGRVYFIVATGLGWLLVLASYRMLALPNRRGAWRLYRLATFPYLGILFLTLALESVL
jgi:protoheme IX farnesyltransferase